MRTIVDQYIRFCRQIINAYKVYSHEALKKIDFEAECLLLKNYLNSADAVTLFPDYPKKIPSVLDQYRMLKNFDFDIGKRTVCSLVFIGYNEFLGIK